MSNWWKKNKVLIIFLGVIGILLALLLLPAFARASYESALEGGMYFEKGVLSIVPDVIKDIPNNIKLAFSDAFSYYKEGLKAFGIFYGGFMLIMILKMSTRNEYEKIEHGSADWCDNKEKYSILSPKEGMILAEKTYLPVLPKPPEGKNGNILVIGGSGAGKSASFVIPNALQMLGSYVFTDPKGELYDRTAGFFEKNGYKVHVINLQDPRYSDGYNPLSHIRGTLDVDTIVKIVSKKEGGDKKGGDPFWDQTSEALLKAVIYYVLLNRPPEEHSFASCLALLRLGGENEGEELKNIFMSLPFENPARRAFETIRLGSDKTFANILVSLAAKLDAFDSEEISAMTSTNTIDFKELVDEKSVLYFITPATNDTYNFLMNIFFSQMLDRLYEYADSKGGSLPIPLFLILDEFANIGRIPRFEQILSTCRSYRINISIILQSIDQLIAIYDEKVTENIMANCSTHLFLGSNAQKTLETFSKQLGEKTITRDNVSRNTDKEGQFSGRGYSDQIMGRALMTPDELRRMSTNECIIFLQAMKPIKANKYWYFRMHPKAKEARENEINHKNISEPKRGEYRITNPYELTSNSLDDLFGAPEKSEDVSIDVGVGVNATSTVATPVNKVEEKKSNEDYDLQAELEKKFDELFGAPNKK